MGRRQGKAAGGTVILAAPVGLVPGAGGARLIASMSWTVTAYDTAVAPIADDEPAAPGWDS